MKTLHIIGQQQVAPGLLLMNAPCPLQGKQTLQGDFMHGTHYAAVDPEDTETIQANIEMGAWAVKYYTDDEARTIVLRHATQKLRRMSPDVLEQGVAEMSREALQAQLNRYLEEEACYV